MRVSLIKKDKKNDLILPKIIKGTYWITDTDEYGNEKNLICIEANNGKWKLVSNNEVFCFQNETVVPFVILENNNFYIIKRNSTKEDTLILYCSSVIEQSYSNFDIDDYRDKEITVGKDSTCQIVYNSPNVLSKHLSIVFNDGNFILTPFGVTYVNNNFINSSYVLANGDIIFVMGLKIILQIKNNKVSLLVNNPNNMVNCKLGILAFNDNEDKSYVEPEEEIDVSLYSDDDNFHKKPRFIRKIEELELNIDTPPTKYEPEDRPWVLTVGPMITMSAMSVVTAFTAINNVTANGMSLTSALPSLVLSGVMFSGSLIWPAANRKYENIKRDKEEKIRQMKYKKYIDEKRNLIQEEISKQKQILIDNYPTSLECQNIVLSKMTRLWERRIGDEDFLTVNLGLGNHEMKINIKYPEERFTMIEDNLSNLARELGKEPKLIQNASIPLSLIESNILGIIGNNVQTSKYMSELFLQIMAFHSYDDLKIVMLTNKEKEQNWEFLKILPHCFNDERNIRFFGTTNDEYKEIFYFLEKNFIERINSNNNETEFKPHYLLVTDSFKSIRNFDIINKILNTKENIGFSLVILTEKITNVPDQCKSFINIYQEKAELYKNFINNKAQTFSIAFDTNYKFYECSKILANTPIDIVVEQEGQLPNNLSFLQMYDVGKIEQLNSQNRWEKNNPIFSLAAPVGQGKNGEKIVIDLHEKYHGPHGLIAGMTGSGKSEFIITYILSMAINYHPNEVQFILIDYKGGGLAGAFENNNTGLKLPHLVGTITNLDTNEIKRSLLSIESELKRRQVLFNLAREKSGESTVDIYKYQKMYREGIVEEPISHLFIISDEFAELKNQQPDFMSQLISTARIGRSLGVHLILATQKPSGVVDPQIWSNTRFRVCLRVQEKADSTEVIKKPDAAFLKQTGRFYFQVGFDEIFVMGQSAWCGNHYIPAEKNKKELDTSINFIDNIGNIFKSVETKKQIETGTSLGEELTNIVKYLSNLAVEENIKTRPLWLEKIPETIYVNNLIKKYNYKKENFVINPVIGEYDNPTMQQQNLLTLPLSKKGNALVYGVTGSGKENFIMTLIYSSMITYTPSEVNFYVIDFGTEVFKIFRDAPIVGDVLYADDKEKIINLYKMLQEEVEKRKKLFSNYNGEYELYCKKSGNTLPTIVVVINNFEAYQDTYEEYDEILNVLSRDGDKYGIYFVFTVNTPGGLRTKLRQNFTQEFVLQQNNQDDYISILGNVNKIFPSKFFGRGIFRDEYVYEFQTALICQKDRIQDYIKELSKKQYSVLKEKVKEVPILPDEVSYSSIKDELGKTNDVIIGIAKSNLEVIKFNFRKSLINLITTMDLSLSYNFIKPFINQLLYLNYSKITFINTEDYILESEYSNYIEYVDSEFDNYIQKLYDYILDNNNKYIESDYNKKIFENLKSRTIIILGFDTLKNKLNIENARKISEIFNKAKDLGIINFVFIDSVDKMKKLELELWYKNNANPTDGIWIGQGISEQFCLKVLQRTNELKELIDDDFCFVIKKGKPILVKYVTNLELKLK